MLFRSGTFENITTFASINGPQNLAIGDFNEDGILDFAVPNSYSNDLAIHLGVCL